MPKTRVLLWDHDGVLVDTERHYFDASRRVLRKLGFDLTQVAYLELMARGASCWSWAIAQGCSEQDALRGRAERDELYQELLRSEPIEIPGVETVVAALAPHYRMAIVTTALRTDFDLIHRDLMQRDRASKRPPALIDHFDAVIANGDYACSKPAPDPYLRALEVLGADPQEALAIEDSSRGLRAAIAAGVDCVVVHSEFTATQDFSGAYAQMNSLGELPGVLEARDRGGI